MTMRDDEARFLRAVQTKADAESVRSVIDCSDIVPKRAWYLLEKWARKGWYEYGVTVDLGWLTEAGKEANHDPA